MTCYFESGWSMTIITQDFRKLVVIGLWMLCVGAAHADGFCGPGAYDPNNGRAPAITCVPIQGYEQPTPQPPSQHWERRWGAIATDVHKGIVESVTDKPSKREAEQSVIKACTMKGGAPCKLQSTYDNECVAMVVGNTGLTFNTGETKDTAIQRATQTCTADGDKGCHVYYSACSLPVRIR